MFYIHNSNYKLLKLIKFMKLLTRASGAIENNACCTLLNLLLEFLLLMLCGFINNSATFDVIC